jgi:SAM-dependent methyltransferase
VPKALLMELWTRRPVARIPEPDLVMADAEHVDAFADSGDDDALFDPFYIFYSAHVSEIVRPGDTVLDLGCGPANALAWFARLNPETRFIGMDLSEAMLTRARERVAALRLDNVEFVHGDITNLRRFRTGSIDAVTSTMALHHLPDLASLSRTLSEVDRVRRRGGGLFLADFARMRSERAMRLFAHQYRGRQPEAAVMDYLHSLRAAFHWRDYAALTGEWDFARLYRTVPMSFLMTVKSPARRTPTSEVVGLLRQIRDRLPQAQARDLRDLRRVFRWDGLKDAL